MTEEGGDIIPLGVAMPSNWRTQRLFYLCVYVLMDPVKFLKLFFSGDQIIIYWNKLHNLHNLVGLPVWFYWTISP